MSLWNVDLASKIEELALVFHIKRNRKPLFWVGRLLWFIVPLSYIDT